MSNFLNFMEKYYYPIANVFILVEIVILLSILISHLVFNLIIKLKQTKINSSVDYFINQNNQLRFIINRLEKEKADLRKNYNDVMFKILNQYIKKLSHKCLNGPPYVIVESRFYDKGLELANNKFDMKKTIEEILNKFRILCDYENIYCFKNAVGYKVCNFNYNVKILLYINEAKDDKKYYVFEFEKTYKNTNLKTKFVKSSVALTLLEDVVEEILLFLGFEKKE